MTVYKPDEREYVPPILMTAKPWSTIGRIQITNPAGNTAGTCTGTLVGPNLVLTASHCIPWNTIQGTQVVSGKIEFLPASYLDAPAAWKTLHPNWVDFIPPILDPLPVATRVYAYLKQGGDDDFTPEGLFASAFDMAILRLDPVPSKRLE